MLRYNLYRTLLFLAIMKEKNDKQKTEVLISENTERNDIASHFLKFDAIEDKKYSQMIMNADSNEIETEIEYESQSPTKTMKINESEVKFESASDSNSSDTKVSNNDKTPVGSRYALI